MRVSVQQLQSRNGKLLLYQPTGNETNADTGNQKMKQVHRRAVVDFAELGNIANE